MAEAYIIDACRTPRGIGKQGKGALAHLHPQHLAATVLSALRDRNDINTSEVDDIIWGTSSQRGAQGADLGRMAALDAGYDVKASGVTLDRFCGSGITTVNLAAAQVMQVKLLRALQEGEVDPVGARRPVKVDVRIISATNRDLAQRVKEGAFREDLFYRLNVYPVEMPSLRERTEDIPALVDHFIGRFNASEGTRIVGAAEETLKMLNAFDWPGNVRQLENAVFRAVILCEGEHLQPHGAVAL